MGKFKKKLLTGRKLLKHLTVSKQIRFFWSILKETGHYVVVFSRYLVAVAIGVRPS